MKLEEKLVSFKLARKLKQAGAKQESQAWWCEEIDEGHKLYASSIASIRMAIMSDLEQWSAFDCPELLEGMPCQIQEGDRSYVLSLSHETEKVFTAFYEGLGDAVFQKFYAWEDTPAEALGNLKLWLLQNGHIKE